MALLVGLAVLVLTPSTEGKVSKNVMSSVFMHQDEVEDLSPLTDHMIDVVGTAKYLK